MNQATTPPDRLLTFREVNALLGSNCKTSATVRSYAASGLIRAVRINVRVVRYSERSVLEMIAGRATQ
jgi:predicted DNA-binding transcriptional regulator AlpA